MFGIGALEHWQYLALLAGALLVTIPLEFIYGFRVWRDPKRLFRTLWPSALLFVIWDLYAINRGHWTFNPKYVTGVEFVGGLPIEEFLFFLLIPAAAISGFEATRTQLSRWKSRA